MATLRKYSWLITLGALALLLLARQLQKREGGRRSIVVERVQGVQADRGAPPPPTDAGVRRAAPSRPVHPLTPSAARISRRDALTAGAFGGRLIDADAIPLPGVAITFVDDAGEGHVVRTDGQGAFRFSPPHPGRFTLSLPAPWAPAAETQLYAEPGVVLTGLTLGARRGDGVAKGAGVPGAGDAGVPETFTIAGVASTTPEGAPVQAVTLEVKAGEYDAPADTLRRALVVSRDGHFALLGFPAGTYRVQAYAAGRAPVERRITLPAPAPSGVLTLPLGPGGDIRGSVTSGPDAGAPAAAAEVVVRGRFDLGEHPVPFVLRTRADAEGRFELPGVGHGSATLEARGEGGRNATLTDLRLLAGQTTTLDVTLAAP